MKPTVYLIPTFLDESGLQTLPAYILDAIKQCHAFFVENERTARRFMKVIWKEMVIDDYQWILADKTTIEQPDTQSKFKRLLKEGKTIGILSEAGCPGIADPGQVLVALAHEQNILVKPLVGPSSIFLALMASGLNGQAFTFHGYLPIESVQRVQKIKEMETESHRKNGTQIFIETPYRNNQLLEVILKNCKPQTLLCIAANITGDKELIVTKSIEQWRKKLPELHKQPAIFLLQGG